MSRTDIIKADILKGRPMFFNEPKVRQRITQCLPTVTIRTRPTDEYRHAVTGNYFKKTDLGVILSTKTMYDFLGLDDNVFAEHLLESGFNSVKEWKDAVKRQHRIEKKTDVDDNEKLYVIRVSPICKRPKNI